MKIHRTQRTVLAAALLALTIGPQIADAQQPAAPASSASAATAPAYYVAEFEVTDREGLKPYAEKVESTFAPYSGRYVVRGGQVDGLEGTTPKARMVMIEFDSLAQARAWYNSPEYTALRPIRQKSGHTNAYIMEGVPGAR
jgi:uncharacterized protein (DUF1330 family)